MLVVFPGPISEGDYDAGVTPFGDDGRRFNFLIWIDGYE